MTSGRGLRAEDGSAAVEMAIVTPLLMLIVAAVVGLGRVEEADLSAQIAAGAAGRAAALARTPKLAVAAAERMAASSAAACPRPTVAVDTSAFRPGGTVSVSVTCHPSMADITSIGLPGSLSVKEQVTDGIDQWRAAGQP